MSIEIQTAGFKKIGVLQDSYYMDRVIQDIETHLREELRCVWRTVRYLCSEHHLLTQPWTSQCPFLHPLLGKQ